MKKRILSLILVLMLVPFASIFSACGKANVYNLDNLDDDYFAIVEDNNNVKKNDLNHLVFDYDGHGDFATIISETKPYDELANYNSVFYNLMAFANEYIDECSNNSASNKAEIKNEVNTNLQALKNSIYHVNECANSFAEIINASKDVDVKSSACLIRFKNLLVSYEDLYLKASKFNNALANLYFNHVLRDGNPNVFESSLESFDASVVINKIRSRIAWQKSNLSQCFVEMVADDSCANMVANSTATFDLTRHQYSDNIEALNTVFEETQAVEIANHENNKEMFYKYAVQAYNMQEALNNNRERFVTACNDIEYTAVKEDGDSTAYQKMCASIIDANNNLIREYNTVLKNMLEMIKKI